MPSAAMLSLIEERLDAIYHAGDVTPIAQPHSTGWRTLPFMVNAYVTGSGMLEIGGRGARLCPSGHALCVPAGVLHRGTLRSPRGISRWSHVSFLILGGIDVFSLLDCPPIFHGKEARRLGEINTELAALASAATPTLEHLATKRSLAFALLATIARVSTWRAGTDRLVLDSQRLSPVFAAIQKNLNSRIRVENLAEAAFLSVPRFHVVFRKATGMAPYVFVQSQRLKRAQELLLSTDLSIAEIAAQTGQRDPFFFSRTFKKQCRMSPTEYRKTVTEHRVP